MRQMVQKGWSTALVALVMFGAYLVLSLARWHRGAIPSWDLGIFEQAVKGYANLGAPIVDIKGPGFNQLGDHFSPLLVVLAPFYRVFPSPVTLLVAQCVLVAVSVIPITTTARRLLGSRSGIAIGAAYGLSWGIQSAVDVQFHEYALAAPLLAFGLCAALEERWVAACVWIGLLLGVKEDLGLTVIGFGVLLWIWGERRRGLWMVGIGAGGMALVLGVIIPFFNPQGRYDYWGKLGDEDSALATQSADLTLGGQNLFGTVQDAVVALVSPGVKVETLMLLLLITGFVALRSPVALIAVPTIVWRFLGSTEHYWGTGWHYSLILMPVMFAATIDGIRKLRSSTWAWGRGYGKWSPVAVVTIALALCPRFPLWDLTKPSSYRQPIGVMAAERAVDAVPPGATVAADLGFVVQMVTDHTVYWIGTTAQAPEYVAINQTRGWGGKPPRDVAAYAERRFPGAIYTQVFNEHGRVVVKRVVD